MKRVVVAAAIASAAFLACSSHAANPEKLDRATAKSILEKQYGHPQSDGKIDIDLMAEKSYDVPVVYTLKGTAPSEVTVAALPALAGRVLSMTSRADGFRLQVAAELVPMSVLQLLPPQAVPGGTKVTFGISPAINPQMKGDVAIVQGIGPPGVLVATRAVYVKDVTGVSQEGTKADVEVSLAVDATLAGAAVQHAMLQVANRTGGKRNLTSEGMIPEIELSDLMSEAVPPPAKATLVFKRFDDGWRVVGAKSGLGERPIPIFGK